MKTFFTFSILAFAACGSPDRNRPDAGADASTIDSSGNQDGSGNVDPCSDAAKKIYVVDQNNTLATFDPTTKTFHDRRGHQEGTLATAYVGQARAQRVFCVYARWSDARHAEGPLRIEYRFRPRSRLPLSELPRMEDPFSCATLVYWERGVDPEVDAVLDRKRSVFRERGLEGVRLLRTSDGQTLMNRLRAPGFRRLVDPSLVLLVDGGAMLGRVVDKVTGIALSPR